MKNVCSSVVMCMLLLSADRVSASEDLSKLSRLELEGVFMKEVPCAPFLAPFLNEYDDNIRIKQIEEARSQRDNPNHMSVPFKTMSNDSRDGLFQFEVDSFGNILKGDTSKKIKEAFDVKFCVLSPFPQWDDTPIYPYHIKKFSPSPFENRGHICIHDLSKISSVQLFDLFDNKKGYRDPYLVYAAVGVFASQMSVADDDIMALHEKIVNFIHDMHPLQIQSENDIVSIKGREPDHIVGEDKYGRKYSVKEILHDVTVADMMKLVAEPCLGDASPFDDDKKNMIADALGDKGFGGMIVEKGFMTVMDFVKSAQQSSIVRNEA